MSSLTNQIVANIKKTADSLNASSYINSQNVICIDSSENRIGINTKFPEYAIHISGDTIKDSIYTRDIYVRNLVETIDISSNNIISNDISCNSFYTVSGIYEELSGSFIFVNNLSAYDISIAEFFCQDISTLKLDVSGESNLYNLNVNNILTTDTLNANNFNLTQITLQDITISNDAIIGGNIYVDGISCDFISVRELSLNNLYIKNNAEFLQQADFQNINVNSDASFVSIFSQNTITNTISSETIYYNTISGNIINVSNIISQGNTIISNGTFGDTNNPTAAIFSDISLINLNVTNIDVSNVLINTGLTDLSNGDLIIPTYKENITTSISGSIALDKDENVLKIYNNNRWNNVTFSTNYATYNLDNSVQGNNIIYTVFTDSFSIDNSENIFLTTDNLSPYYNYKYIPIKLVSGTNKFTTIDNGKILLINDICDNQIFEINTTLVIRFLNRIPGDVEPNTYKFGIYPNVLSALPIIDSVDNSFIEINNSVIAFDNSYNYSQSYINYIGPLGNSSNIILRNGFSFYISSEKDLKYINIDSFNVTIKQLI